MRVRGRISVPACGHENSGSRRLLGWATEDQMPTALVAGADKAVEQRGGRVAGVIFRSERGSQGQYSSVLYTDRIDEVRAAEGRSVIPTTPWPNRSWSSSGPSCTATPHTHRQRRSVEKPRRPRASPRVPGCRGSTRSSSTANSTTGRRPMSKPTTVRSLSQMRHERTKQLSLRKAQAGSVMRGRAQEWESYERPTEKH